MLGAQEIILPKQSVIPAILPERISPECGCKLLSNLPFLAESKISYTFDVFGPRAILLTVCGGDFSLRSKSYTHALNSLDFFCENGRKCENILEENLVDIWHE